MLSVLKDPHLHQLFESWLERHSAASLLKVKEMLLRVSFGIGVYTACYLLRSGSSGRSSLWSQARVTETENATGKEADTICL